MTRAERTRRRILRRYQSRVYDVHLPVAIAKVTTVIAEITGIFAFHSRGTVVAIHRDSFTREEYVDKTQSPLAMNDPYRSSISLSLFLARASQSRSHGACPRCASEIAGLQEERGIDLYRERRVSRSEY